MNMSNDYIKKVIIVEGITDKKQIENILTEDVIILCTNGTLGVERFDALLEEYELDNRDVYILVDEDEPGFVLRNQLRRELPHAKHLYINSNYKEVAETPKQILANLLATNHFSIRPLYLL